MLPVVVAVAKRYFNVSSVDAVARDEANSAVLDKTLMYGSYPLAER